MDFKESVYFLLRSLDPRTLLNTRDIYGDRKMVKNFIAYKRNEDDIKKLTVFGYLRNKIFTDDSTIVMSNIPQLVIKTIYSFYHKDILKISQNNAYIIDALPKRNEINNTSIKSMIKINENMPVESQATKDNLKEEKRINEERKKQDKINGDKKMQEIKIIKNNINSMKDAKASNHLIYQKAFSIYTIINDLKSNENYYENNKFKISLSSYTNIFTLINLIMDNRSMSLKNSSSMNINNIPISKETAKTVLGYLNKATKELDILEKNKPSDKWDNFINKQKKTIAIKKNLAKKIIFLHRKKEQMFKSFSQEIKQNDRDKISAKEMQYLSMAGNSHGNLNPENKLKFKLSDFSKNKSSYNYRNKFNSFKRIVENKLYDKKNIGNDIFKLLLSDETPDKIANYLLSDNSCKSLINEMTINHVKSLLWKSEDDDRLTKIIKNETVQEKLTKLSQVDIDSFNEILEQYSDQNEIYNIIKGCDTSQQKSSAIYSNIV